MRELTNLLVGGMVAGGLYAVLAVGVVLTYQASGIFNLAHGATAFATAFLFFELDTGLGWPVPVAAAVALGVFAPAFGWGLDRLLFRQVATAPDTVRLVVPLGVLIAVPSLCLLVVDRANAWLGAGLPTHDRVLAIPGLGPHPKVTWRPGGVVVDSNQVAILAAAVLSSLLLWVLLRHTALGLRMRAVVDRRSLAQLRGVDADRTSSVAWMLGSVLAGLAGILLAPLFTLDPTTFTTVVLISTPAVVLARFRSLPVALAGGLGIGVVGNLITGYADFARGITGLRIAVPFLILYVLLFFFGPDRSRQAGQSREAPAAATALRDRALAWGAGAVLVLGVALFWADDYWQGLIARGLALGLVLLSFTILTGVGGMVSLAQATFVTAAAFTAGWALSRGWPFVAALAAGTVVAAVLGAVVALPARRLGGLPLALSTMALAFGAQFLVFQLDAVSHQSRSGWELPPPALGPVDLGDGRVMVVVLAALVGLAVLAVRNLRVSSSGRALMALQASEAGARTVGIRAHRLKITVFALSAALAGFGGVFLATTTGRVTNVDFPVEIGLFWLAAVVVFGIRRPAGAVLAGLSAALAPELFRAVSDRPLLPAVIFGLAALGLARNPDGLLGMTRRRAAGMRGHQRPVAPGPGGVTPTADTDAPALHLAGVTAGYGDAVVLHGVDLVVPRGGAVALVGSNGAGKSTVCAVAAGLLAPAQGRVLLDGADVTTEPAHRRARPSAGERKDRPSASLIPEGRGVFPSLTVDENLALWLPDRDDRARAYERFPALAARRAQPAGALSGGEQQMLALAPALVRPPALLIVDEPSLGLAPRIVEQVHDAIREIRRAGTAVLLVEEKAHDVLASADTVAFLDAGRVAWTAPTAEVDEDRLTRSYLGIDGAADDAPAPAPLTHGGST